MPYCFANNYVATDFANGLTKILFSGMQNYLLHI